MPPWSFSSFSLSFFVSVSLSVSFSYLSYFYFSHFSFSYFSFSCSRFDSHPQAPLYGAPSASWPHLLPVDQADTQPTQPEGI